MLELSIGYKGQKLYFRNQGSDILRLVVSYGSYLNDDNKTTGVKFYYLKWLTLEQLIETLSEEYKECILFNLAELRNLK